MFKRRHLLFFITIIFISLLITAGCGGGGGGETTEDTTAQDGAPAGGQAAPVPTTSTTEAVKIPRDFSSNDEMPDFVQKAITEKRPFAIIFYLKDDYTWKEVKPEYDNVKSTYNQIPFYYIDIDSTKKDPKTSKLALALEVKYLPQIFLINQQSKVVYQHNGYIDRDTLKNDIHEGLALK